MLVMVAVVVMTMMMGEKEKTVFAHKLSFET
jgi:hypothetical protein